MPFSSFESSFLITVAVSLKMFSQCHGSESYSQKFYKDEVLKWADESNMTFCPSCCAVSKKLKLGLKALRDLTRYDESLREHKVDSFVIFLFSFLELCFLTWKAIYAMNAPLT